jgi:hypothetical protein
MITEIRLRLKIRMLLSTRRRPSGGDARRQAEMPELDAALIFSLGHRVLFARNA